MTDPSQLTNEQLMAIAGPPAGQRQPAPQRQPRPQAAAFPGDPEQTIRGLIPNVNITSRTRTPERNRAVGGSPNSYHLRGQAFDLTPGPGQTMAQLEAQLRQSGLPFQELINEGDHVHVAWSGVGAPSQAYQPVSGPMDGTDLSNEELIALAGDVEPSTGGVEDVVIEGGVVRVGDRAVLRAPGQPDQDIGSWADRENRINRRNDPNYVAEYEQALARSENVPAIVSNLFQGQTLGALPLLEGALGYITPNVEGGSRDVASQAARDASRDRLARLMREDPLGTFGAQLAGGLLTPGVNAAGNYISGAQGAARLGRAGAVGAGYGGAAGLIGSEGNVGERLDDAALNALVGGGVGVVGQRVLDRALPQAATSAARRLSRQGVDLTPGQMMSEVPVVGSTVKYAEDILGGFNPLMTGVRQRQNEDVIRAAGNEALSSLANSGPAVTLPRNARTGYEVSQAVRRVLGDSYDEVTARINAVADNQLGQDMADLVVRAGDTLDDASLGRLERILNSGITNRVGTNGEISGRAFKDIEESLRIARDKLDRPGATLEAQETAEFVDEARDAVRNLIARQYPEEAQRISDINRGWANYKRIERAVAGAPGMARQGTPTPSELTQAVDQMSSTSQIVNQTGLMQGLASDARTVLPATVGDTGSGQRAVLGTLGVLGTTGAAAINPGLAAGIATGAIVYSRPGIAALNAVYRATDSQTAREAVQALARLAQRDPALIPYYEAALQYALPDGQTQTQANPQGQQSAPSPMSVQ